MTDYQEFDRQFDGLLAVARQRLSKEVHYHRLGAVPELHDYMEQFGRVLAAVYRYGLKDALVSETAWYASLFKRHGWGKDMLSVILDSWIIAIEGIVKMPEAGRLSGLLREVRQRLGRMFETDAQAGEVAEDIQALTRLLTGGDFAGCRDMLSGVGPEAAITEYILPAMRYVGRVWQENGLAVYQEHLATQTALRFIYYLLGRVKGTRGHTALVGSVPGEAHFLVTAALSTFLELRGWRTWPMGTSLDKEHIVEAVATLQPEVVFLSLMMLARLPDAIGLVEDMRREFPGLLVCLGGRGTVYAKDVLREMDVLVGHDFAEVEETVKAKLGA